MLAMIIIITFYVIDNAYYYLILTAALYEWVCISHGLSLDTG